MCYYLVVLSRDSKHFSRLSRFSFMPSILSTSKSRIVIGHLFEGEGGEKGNLRIFLRTSDEVPSVPNKPTIVPSEVGMQYIRALLGALHSAFFV